MSASISKPKPVHVLSSTQARVLEGEAGTLATMLASIPELTASLERAVKIDFESKLTTAEVHFSLFGNTEKVSAEEFSKWPEFGSMEGRTGNKPFDKYTYKDPDGKERDASFWRNVAQKHPFGAALLAKKKKLMDAGKEGVVNEYSKEAVHDREADIGDIDTQFSTFFGKLKLAVQLGHAMTRANTELAGVIEVTYDTKPVMVVDGGVRKPKMENGKIVREVNMNSPRIMVIKDLAREGVATRKTIANFLRLNVDIALAKGGTYEEFITSNARGTPDDENETITEETIKIGDPLAFENATIQTNHFINGWKNDSAKNRQLIMFYLADDAEDRLMSLFNLAENLTHLTGNKAIKDKYEAILNGTEAPKQKAA